MANSSKNVFSIDGDTITISHSDGDFIATASLREDYEEEIQSVTWSKNGNYVYIISINFFTLKLGRWFLDKAIPIFLEGIVSFKLRMCNFPSFISSKI